MMSGLSEKAKLAADTKQELMGLKTKKALVTKNLNKCQQLLDACKGEIPLSKTSAEDALTLYNRTKVCLNNLEVNMETYLDLLIHTYLEPDPPPAVEEQQSMACKF